MWLFDIFIVGMHELIENACSWVHHLCVFFSFLLLLFSTSASLGLLVYFKVVVFWCVVGVPASLASMKIYCNWEKIFFEERPHCVFHIWVAPMLWFSSLEWVHRNCHWVAGGSSTVILLTTSVRSTVFHFFSQSFSSFLFFVYLLRYWYGISGYLRDPYSTLEHTGVFVGEYHYRLLITVGMPFLR